MYVDKVKMQDLLMNLLTNAVKYTISGGRVDFDFHTEDKNMRIRVSDNGIGISKEFLEKIFEPFPRSRMHREEALEEPVWDFILCEES